MPRSRLCVLPPRVLGARGRGLRSLAPILVVCLSGLAPGQARAQFATPIPRAAIQANHLCEVEPRLFATTSEDACLERFAERRHEWFFPLLYNDRELAKSLYERGTFGALDELSVKLREDQVVASSPFVAGAIGALPFEIRGLAVATEVTPTEEEEAGADLDPEAEADLVSRLTALIRNSGNLSARLTLPIFLTWGPNTRSGLSLAGDLGLVGDVATVEDVQGTWFAGLDGGMGFTLRSAEDSVVANLELPARFGRVGIFGGDVADGVLERSGFWALQVGLGVTDAENDRSIAIVFSHPLAADVREHVPSLLLDLRTAIPTFGGGDDDDDEDPESPEEATEEAGDAP